MNKPPPPFSIVVPAYHRREGLVKCLKALTALSYPADRYEIIVVDDQSTDNTAELVASLNYSIVKLIKLDNNTSGGKKKALEYAIEQSSSEIIVQTDADVIVPGVW